MSKGYFRPFERLFKSQILKLNAENQFIIDKEHHRYQVVTFG
jgi:hypothetical protein